MRSSLILGVVLLLTIAHIAQARKLGCSTCGGSLGSGTNPCKCEDVVVRAADVQKPLYLASPEIINEAATAREVARLVSSKTFPGAAPFQGCSQTNGLYSVNGGISHTSSSSVSRNSASTSSTVNLLGGSVGRGDSLYSLSPKPAYNSGCGCGSKSKVSTELSDLLSPEIEGKVAPRFPPIGDLCAPPSQQAMYEVSTKVTPAYPQLNFRPYTSTPLCVDVVNGQINRAGLEKIASATSYNNIGRLFGGGSISSAGATDSFGGYSSNVASNSFGQKWGDSNQYFSGVDGTRGGRYGTVNSWYKPSSSGTGLWGQLSRSQDSGIANLEVSSGTSSAFDVEYGNIYPQEPVNRRKYLDFGDDLELPEDYSYPRQPADAVSLTLAYKNLFPHTAVYNRKWFVPEDKLAFGHRTVPVEWKPSKRTSDIPEEKLQILDKPIVELKPIAPIPVSVGIYDEQEEAKLAELEVIERERINQEETASQPQGNVITYGELGYAPIDGFLVPGRALTRSGALHVNSGIAVVDAEDVNEGCGPVGPPVPGYVPGTVTINREVVEIEGETEDDRKSERVYGRHYLDDMEDEEDDVDGTTSGIFARLRDTAQKYGQATCPR